MKNIISLLIVTGLIAIGTGLTLELFKGLATVQPNVLKIINQTK